MIRGMNIGGGASTESDCNKKACVCAGAESWEMEEKVERWEGGGGW